MKPGSLHKRGISLQGNIATIELNNIFQFFDYAALTGELRVFTDHNNASFYFQKGILIYGSLSVNQKKIGDLLLESGFLTEANLAKCLRIHTQSGKRKRLGDILVEEGFVEFDDLAEMLRKQAREAFFETLRWKMGMFYFYANHSPLKDEVLINERIDRMLLEGIVRIDNGSSETIKLTES